MRYHCLLLVSVLAAACAPGSAARRRAGVDPTARVRMLGSQRALAGTSHRVLDTLATTLGGDGMNHRNLAEIRLRALAAERGANAIVLLDTTSAGQGARLRAVAIRVDESPDDVREICLRGKDDLPAKGRLPACERLVEREPLSAEAWKALAEQRRALWDDRGERVALERYLALRPDDATAWHALGHATSGRGNRAAKLAAWRRAAALDTAYVAPRLALGIALATDRARAADALPWLDAAARLGGRGEALYWKGRALLQLERWTDAHDAFAAAAEAGGMKRAWAYGGAAYALSRAGRHAEAVALWDRVLAIDSGWFNVVTREHDMIRDEKSAWKRSRSAVGR